tara:strand:+ start:4161 stop:5456 length:1296 start_codon:yes stop_codon:yes gene_type:complete
MLTVISSFLGVILVMGMDSAQSMYFFKSKQKGKDEQACVVSSILQWRLIFGTIVVILGTFLGPFFNTVFFNGKLGVEFFAVAFLSTLFGQLMSQSTGVLRLLYRPWSFISITLTQSILAALLVLFFVLFYDQGILGFFLGVGTASFSVAVIGWYCTRDYLNFNKLHANLWPKLIRFGAPLVPAGLAMYFMSTADRWFIQFYHGSEQLGLFALAAKFSMLMMFAVEVFRKAWWPVALDAMHSNDGPVTFRLIAKIYVGLGCAITCVLTLFSSWLVESFTGVDFHAAWPIVVVLSWQSFLYGFYLIASAGMWKREKTYLSLYISGIAAFSGILLNFILVPKYGAIGAAFATVTTYFLWILLTIFVSERLWRLEHNYLFLFTSFVLSIGTSFWMNFIKVGSYNFYEVSLIFMVLCCVIYIPIKDLLHKFSNHSS